MILDNVKVLFDKLVDEYLKRILWCTLIFLIYPIFSPILAIAIDVTGNVTQSDAV